MIRHGEPARNVEVEHRADPPLSERGMKEAAALASLPMTRCFDAVYTSPQKRARQTAEILADSAGLMPVVRDDLAEFDCDAKEYLHFEDLAAAGDPRFKAFQAGDLSAWGTDPNTFRRRVCAEVDAIVASHKGRQVAVVSHGGVINAYLGSVVGIERLIFHSPDYTSFARVLADRSGRRELISANETPHLMGVRVPW